MQNAVVFLTQGDETTMLQIENKVIAAVHRLANDERGPYVNVCAPQQKI